MELGTQGFSRSMIMNLNLKIESSNMADWNSKSNMISEAPYLRVL